MHRYAVIVPIILLTCVVSAAPAALSPDDSTSRSKSGIYPLPIFFYTPETGTAGGAAALFLYRDSSSSRASAITADVIYTEKKQIITEISGDQYFDRDYFRLLTDLKFQKYPNKFYGIGNNTPSTGEENFTPRSFLFKAVFYTSVAPHVYVGPLIHYETVSMSALDPSGLIAAGILAGSNGGAVSGVGFAANWDSRDNTFATQSGSFYQLSTTFYQKAFAGDLCYTDVQIDARTFYELIPHQILAIQGGAEFIGGSAPFLNLARFGGQNLIRGYYDGRYRDNHGIGLQAEYRVPVWWRFGLVAFGGAAQVADKLNHFAMSKFWCAGGVGLRFAMSPQERINLRWDYGIGNNSSGMYFTVTEAF